MYFRKEKRRYVLSNFSQILEKGCGLRDVQRRANLGTVYLNQGKVQDATNQYQEALRINPNYSEAHNNLGTVFLNQGKVQEAIPRFNEALRMNPNFAEAHYNLGNAYLLMGHRGSALKEYGLLKTISPRLASALHQKMK